MPQEKSWFAITGREGQLAAAELSTVLPNEKLSFGREFAMGIGQPPNFDQLGTVIRSGEVLGKITSREPAAIASEIAQLINITGAERKINLGLSTNCYNPTQLKKIGLELKRALTHKQKLSIRMVFPQQGPLLNAGHIKGGKLLAQPNAELTLFRTEHDTYLGRSSWEQNIASYRMRDRERPARDARIGMLPPKLAQTMLNLAGVDSHSHVHDIFCGTGVVLTEAIGRVATVSGSDINPDMVDATRTNLTWMQQQLGQAGNTPAIWKADAQSVELPPGISHIVSEGYLGNPHLVDADAKRLQSEATTLLPLYKRTLQHLAHYPTPLVILLALPAWYHPSLREPITLPILDVATDMRYTVKQFAPNYDNCLHYHRPHQTVGRMIIKLGKD